ncbi:MAG: hypothetical protein LBG65_01750 [Puniceicoccales bacterium]|jgi:hypothetical protein|nr:hypothetical protein [Puniceicoccales bacterium]
MAKQSTNLLWCLARLGKDLNWWVKKTSDPVNWDMDGLSVIDPRQMGHILDSLDTLREYGLSLDLVDSAFIPLQIQESNADKTVRLIRVNETFIDSDAVLFALPDVLDEEKGPYAEFLDHITKLRVQLLNANIQFEQKLTVDELEEQVRELQTQAYTEGRSIHAFQEISDILEFVPEGYELNVDEESAEEEPPEDDIDIGEGFDLDTDEKIEADDTMRWDEEEDDSLEDPVFGGDEDLDGPHSRKK